MTPLFEELQNKIAHYKAEFVILFCGLLVALVALIFYIFVSNPAQYTPKSSVQIKESTASKPQLKSLVTVDVEGALNHPGVYTLNPTSRVKDALAKAGGISPSADQDFVIKNVNQAQILTDQEKIYIPMDGETDASAAQNNSSQTAEKGAQTVSINTSTSDILDALPGFGTVTVEKLISGRPYQKIEDLVDRKILKKSVFDAVKDSLTI
jgi:competence protein ComEA